MMSLSVIWQLPIANNISDEPRFNICTSLKLCDMATLAQVTKLLSVV